jgi:predicted esterase
MDFRLRGHTPAMETVEYAPGRLADVFGEPAPATMLLWHGAQTDARAAVGPLAGMLAGRGAVVVAADWNSHADDGGRDDLLRSLEFARNLAAETERILLVGWSMGGAAAAGVTLHAKEFGFTPAHTVCLAGAFMVPDPIFGAPLTDGLTAAAIGSPFTLLHGLDDDVVPVIASREFATSLRRIGWPVEVVELAADHASIAGADYDARADRYVPGASEHARQVGAEVAARIAATLRYE